MRGTRNSFRARWRWYSSAGLIVLLAVAVFSQGGNAASTAGAPQQIYPSGIGGSGPATAVVPRGTFEAQGVVPAPGPTIDAAVYRSLKLAADRSGASARKQGGAADSGAELLAPPAQQVDAAGLSASAPFPPDTDGAAGDTQYVQVVNSRVRVVNKATPGTQACTTRPLSAFTNGITEFLFDPRVIYDETWDRWVIVFTRRSTSATDTVRRYFLAVSTSSNACGAFFMYTVPFSGGAFNNGDWWDFPQLGQDQDTIFVTGNVFDTPTAPSSKTTVLHPIAKARVYNGLSFSAGIFTGLVGTLAPPTLIAHDQNRDAIFLAAPSNGTHLREYTLRESSRPNGQTLLGPTLIDVPNYAVPPAADQPGTTLTLDTSDNRFANRHVQYTNSAGNIIVWQTHAIADGGFATPKFYQVNATTNTVPQQGSFFRSSCSDDFNPSIAANTLNEAVVTWSAVQDPANAAGCAAVNAEVRASGRQPGDAAGSMNSPPGVLIEGSATFYDDLETPTPERWGDYSAVSVDPAVADSCAARRRFWLTNQNNPTTTTSVWGSRISRVGFC